MMPRIAIAVLLLGAAACDQKPAAGRPPQARPAFGGDFSLTNQDGGRFQLKDLRGRPAVLFFGYTSCPDMCPATMSRIAGALGRVRGDASSVAVLFVTVDPRRDTPAVLKEYVKSFATPLVGLTGTEPEVNRVAAQYHASTELVPTGTTNYLMNHTSAIFLIDRQGKLRQYFKFDAPPGTLADAIDAVLDEQP